MDTESMTDAEFAACKAQAAEAGKRAGHATGTWLVDGNTSDATRAKVRQGIEDGDPEVMDSLPWCDLGGQWADGLTEQDIIGETDADPESLEPEEVTELVDAYREAYDAAMLAEVERSLSA